MYTTFKVNNEKTTLHCRHYGTGKPLVMVHGACVDSYFFHDAAEIMAGNRTVITYDRRGYGKSSDPADGDYCLQAQAEDLWTVIQMVEAMTGQTCDLFAHSAGANIAMAFLERNPDWNGKVLLHEPAVPAILPKEDIIHAQLKDMEETIKEGLHMSAIFDFFSLEGIGDSRARACSEEEVQFRDRNCDTFLEKEFHHVHGYQPDIDILGKRRFAVGLGEHSLETYHGRCNPILCEGTENRTLYFPGGHNGAFDLPEEFACMLLGYFLVDRDETQK